MSFAKASSPARSSRSLVVDKDKSNSPSDDAPRSSSAPSTNPSSAPSTAPSRASARVETPDSLPVESGELVRRESSSGGVNDGKPQELPISEPVTEQTPTSLTELTPGQLKDLRAGPTINILYRDSDTSTPFMLYQNFPQAIAGTFSSTWKTQLPIRSKSSRRKSKIPPSPIIITSGHAQMHNEILKWMMMSCDGKGLRAPPHRTSCGFFFNYLLRLCSHIIGCEHVTEIASARMQNTANAQIHPEDVRCIWLMRPEDVAMKAFVADHVATRFWKKTLRHRIDFWTLRNELPEFDRAINDSIGKIKGPGQRQQQQQQQQKVGSEEGIAMGQGDASDTNGHDRAPSTSTSGRRPSADRPKCMQKPAVNDEHRPHRQLAPMQGPEQDLNVQNGMLRAEVVRKASNGRPTWAKLDLATMGITRRGFCGNT